MSRLINIRTVIFLTLVLVSFYFSRYKYNPNAVAEQKNLQLVLTQLARLRRQHSYLLGKLQESPWLIDKTSVPLDPISRALLAEGEGPSIEYESLRRRIYSNIKETCNYISSELKNKTSGGKIFKQEFTTILEELAARKRSLLSDLEKFEELDGYQEWRGQEAANVSDLVQRRLHHLQNPSDCRAARKLVCHHDACGFGCDHHHLAYCLIFAYATRRTLVLYQSNWKFKKGNFSWTNVFLNLSETCTSVYNDRIVLFKGLHTRKVLYLNTYGKDLKLGRAKIHPYYIPEDLALRILRFNGDPRSWWLGQMLKYIQRPLRDVKTVIDDSIARMNVSSPIVGYKFLYLLVVPYCYY